MASLCKEIEEKLKLLPDSPGVYLMKNKKGEILYVGKASKLKNRVRSYFSDRFSLDDSYQQKIVKLVSQITDFDYIMTSTEEEAFLLEANLIKKHRPRYNVSLKDDKKYPFIKITLFEPYPRVLIDRDLEKDGSRYFGPYSDGYALKRTLEIIEWLMPLRSCARKIPDGEPIYDKACLNYQLNKCSAPCIGKIEKKEYHKMINNVISFLSGKNREIIESLKEDMNLYSQQMEFEKAAQKRDQISLFEKVQRSQTVYFQDEADRDVVALYKEERFVAVTVLKIIGGKLLNKEAYRLEDTEGSPNNEILASFIKQYYAQNYEKLPKKILVAEEPEDLEQLNIWLKNRIIVPQRGENRALIMIAKKNAFNYVETLKLSHLRKSNRTIFPIQELKDKLQLPKLPRKIICIDISTIQGTDTVGSIVYFENGKPLKKGYRHLKINTISGQDDYGAMKEVLSRYLLKVNEEEIPDLIVIDGGKGQLSSAVTILDKIELKIPIISLAKRVEEIFLPDNKEPVFLPRSASSLRLLASIRDEAHRFAIAYHRKRRSSRTLKSELDSIKGIGKDKKFLLLKQFGSVENIKKAGAENLTSVKGIGIETANKIIAALNRQNTENQE